MIGVLQTFVSGPAGKQGVIGRAEEIVEEDKPIGLLQQMLQRKKRLRLPVMPVRLVVDADKADAPFRVSCHVVGKLTADA
jgi:hypothetical protein